jgi:hypothetical protein
MNSLHLGKSFKSYKLSYIFVHYYVHKTLSYVDHKHIGF